MKNVCITVQAEPKWTMEEQAAIEWVKQHVVTLSKKTPNSRRLPFYKWCTYQANQGPKHFYAPKLMRELKAVQELVQTGKIV